MLIFALAAYGNTSASTPVDTTKARRVAYNFCLSQRRADKVASPWKLRDVTEKLGFSNIHIYTLPDDGGFVIVAGSGSMHPILGYSFESTLTMMGDNMRAWLRHWDELSSDSSTDIADAEWQALDDDEPRPMMSSGASGIPALMATRWNQSPLYNDSCPYDATAQTRVVTGCVATAMAQVMAYWRRPLTGLGQHSYTHELYGLQHANFGATAYDWANMPYTLHASSTPAEIRAEAQLVYHCGVAVEMGYGVGGSSALSRHTAAPRSPRPRTLCATISASSLRCIAYSKGDIYKLLAICFRTFSTLLSSSKSKC